MGISGVSMRVVGVFLSLSDRVAWICGSRCKASSKIDRMRTVACCCADSMDMYYSLNSLKGVI